MEDDDDDDDGDGAQRFDRMKKFKKQTLRKKEEVGNDEI
jgi:hypothetical protein